MGLWSFAWQGPDSPQFVFNSHFLHECISVRKLIDPDAVSKQFYFMSNHFLSSHPGH